MSFILFTFYIVVFTYWLFRWGKNHLASKSFQYIFIIAFLLRVGLGVFMGFYTKDLVGNDSWKLFGASLEETNWLLHKPYDFFYKDILDNNGYQGNPFTSFFFRNSDNHYFNDLKDNLMIKFNAVLNVLSGTNYYINVLIANFLVMWSLLGLAKVFQYWLKPEKSWTIFFVFCLYLPLILWTCSIQKDMVCLILLSTFLYGYTFIKSKQGSKRFLYGSMIMLSAFLMLLIKNYMAIILVGSVLMAKLARPTSKHFNRNFFILGSLAFVVFIVSSYFPSSINFPLLLAKKQHGFYEVASAQPIASIPLTGNIGSYLKNLPNAIFNCFLFPLSRTLLFERIGWIGLAIFLFFILLTICAFKFPRKVGLWQNPFFLSMFCFCLLSYLLIGESVAYYGALLRYRAIPETIACILLLQLIDFKKIKTLYISKKNI